MRRWRRSCGSLPRRASQVTISESGHCPLLLSEGPGPCTFTGSELGWSTLGVRVHWLKSTDAALALSADEALPHSQCQWPHWLVRWFGGAAALPQANTLESTFGVPIKRVPGLLGDSGGVQGATPVRAAPKGLGRGAHHTGPGIRALHCCFTSVHWSSQLVLRLCS